MSTLVMFGFLFNQPSSAVAQIVNQPLQQEAVRGVVKAAEQATISAELTSYIVSIAFKEGESFSFGDILLVFDCAKHRAETEAFRGGYLAARERFKIKSKLDKFGAVGKGELKIAEYELVQADGELRAKEAILAKCVITAPYDGKVVELKTRANETPAPNQPLLRIINNKLQVELIVPSKRLLRLKVGDFMNFVVDETAKTYRIKISRIGAVVEPVSQTVKLIGEFEQQLRNILPGMSGTASIAND